MCVHVAHSEHRQGCCSNHRRLPCCGSYSNDTRRIAAYRLVDRPRYTQGRRAASPLKATTEQIGADEICRFSMHLFTLRSSIDSHLVDTVAFAERRYASRLPRAQAKRKKGDRNRTAAAAREKKQITACLISGDLTHLFLKIFIEIIWHSFSTHHTIEDEHGLERLDCERRATEEMSHVARREIEK